VPRTACYVAEAFIIFLGISLDLWLLTPSGVDFIYRLTGATWGAVLLLDLGVLSAELLFAWWVIRSCHQAKGDRPDLVS
jgi:hypothetical protein